MYIFSSLLIMNFRNHNRIEKKNRRLNQLIRKKCCWNCMQIGHLRFQCPYPRTIRCSFCRKPFVLTINCDCRGQNLNIDVSEHQVQELPNLDENRTPPMNEEYSAAVLVPMNLEDGSIQENIQDNLVVFVDNNEIEDEKYEEDRDVLEINAETDSLDEM